MVSSWRACSSRVVDLKKSSILENSKNTSSDHAVCFKNIANKGISILFVEQNVRLALNMADRGYVLESGHLVIDGLSKDIINSDELKKVFLG